MPRPIVAQIHPAAVSHNLSIVKQRASRSRAWAVVKANAYGHGIDRVFPALANADGIALLDLDEAVRVRELGWTKPILLLEGVFKPCDVQIAQQFDLSMAVHCREQLDLLRLSRSHERVNVHLKMNSGMNRLGFRPDAYRAAWEQASSIAAIADITLMSHFANADDGDVAWQMDRFDAVTQDIPGQRSLANSAAVLWHPQAHRDWVRPGVVLYGGSPTGQSRHIDDVGLRASMTLTSEVIGVQSLSAQETVGYGRAFAANREMRVGVVACGYADGYPRHASTGTPIAIDGVMTQVVGRVSMDMLTVDLTPCPHAQIGSKVELWGEQVKIDDVAHASGTIGYELMCALAKRVPVQIA